MDRMSAFAVATVFGWHRPPEHVAPPHVRPHPPQLFASLPETLMHAVPQMAEPEGHAVQTPALHVELVPHNPPFTFPFSTHVLPDGAHARPPVLHTFAGVHAGGALGVTVAFVSSQSVVAQLTFHSA